MKKPCTRLKGRNPGALTLARFELEQKFIGVGCDAAQLIKRAVMAARNDIPVAQQRRWLLCDGRAQEREGLLVDANSLAHLRNGRCIDGARDCAQRRESCERGAQLRQVARPCRAQCHARKDALDVPDPAQMLAQAFVMACVDESRDCFMAALQQDLIGERPIEPAPQLARTHGGRAFIEQRE
jgi:hypothetical protein